MRRVTYSLIGFAVATAAIAGAAQAENWKKLGEAELKDRFANATISGRSNSGVPFEVTYDAGGKIMGLSGGYADEGTWWVNGDTICRKWKKWDKGQERCSTVEMNGKEGRYERVDGSGSGKWDFDN